MFWFRYHRRRVVFVFFFLMIRRPPRSTLDRSSAASDVYKRQGVSVDSAAVIEVTVASAVGGITTGDSVGASNTTGTVSYTHLRAHETVLDLVCRLLLEKKKTELA